MNELKYSIKQFLNVYKSKDSKKIIKVTKNLIIYVLVLCLLKLPFIFCRDISVDYFNKMNVKNILDSILYYLFELLYILFIILMLRNWLLKEFGTNKKDK